jgi:uncharacterized protein (TIGR03067 family)
MHGGTVATTLPARPNLEHLRTQAKTLLEQLKIGDASATQSFIDYLPKARKMTPAGVRRAGFRLADAQSVVARQNGFAGWAALSRHVEQLRALEGEWRFDNQRLDGVVMPAKALSGSRLLIDGDRFRMESPEAIYDGRLAIDISVSPFHITIDFVEGPEAGNRSYGIYELNGDRLMLCLGLAGASRPAGFAATKGSGHVLQYLRRTSARRPANVTGGTPQPEPTVSVQREDPSAFDVPMTPLMQRLEGEWIPVKLVMDGKPMPDEWLSFGSRTTAGNEMKVVFGGQVMVHAKVRLDETTMPIAVDYLNLNGRQAGTVSRGIMEWMGDEVRFLIASPGHPRPTSFASSATAGTFSQWQRKGQGKRDTG